MITTTPADYDIAGSDWVKSDNWDATKPILYFAIMPYGNPSAVILHTSIVSSTAVRMYADIAFNSWSGFVIQ